MAVQENDQIEHSLSQQQILVAESGRNAIASDLLHGSATQTAELERQLQDSREHMRIQQALTSDLQQQLMSSEAERTRQLAQLEYERRRAEGKCADVEKMTMLMQKHHEAEVGQLKDLVSSQRQELGIWNGLVIEPAEGSGHADRNSDPDARRQVAEVSRMLGESLKTQEIMASEISELRRQALCDQQKHANTIADMQWQLDNHRKARDTSRPRFMRGSASNYHNPAQRLAKIEEEGEDDKHGESLDEMEEEWLAHPGRLRQLENIMVVVKEQFAKERTADGLLQETIVSDGLCQSRHLHRFQEILQIANVERERAEDKITRLMRQLADDVDRSNESMENDQEQQEESLPSSLDQGLQISDLKAQRCFALESKSMADSRLEDYKREAIANEKRYQSEIARLQHELTVAKSKLGSAELSESDALEDLRDEVDMAQQENRMLEHQLEVKEVQWKTQIETLELNHETTISELKRSHEIALSKELKYTKQLEKRVIELESQKPIAVAEPEVPVPQMVTTPPEAYKTVGTNTPPIEALSAHPDAGLFSWLRCPMRRIGGQAQNDPPGNIAGTPSLVTHCQAICWEILGVLPNVTALLCDLPDLSITDATKKACRIWGSAKLHGDSVLTLVRCPSSGGALQKALNDTPTDTRGFLVKDLGCMELSSKHGKVFDSSIIVIRLPEEPQLKRGAVGLIVIEPLSDGYDGRDQGRGHVRNRPNDCRSSTHSLASSASVTPSDSVSRVAEKRAHIQY